MATMIINGKKAEKITQNFSTKFGKLFSFETVNPIFQFLRFLLIKISKSLSLNLILSLDIMLVPISIVAPDFERKNNGITKPIWCKKEKI
ncbi:hypothetical protein [Lacihabitans sp. LS3-19]|uniref:hypothetical protein n=1 Tax=Lacihabitans sp. LS3-19 TaxID=2487335 RepID=UPI0020CB7C5F|nr:hypothetical protein [Lacihabitans sp. LS3-19]